MPESSVHLTPARLRLIGETAPAVAQKVADGTITTRFYQKMLGENPHLRAFFNMSNQRSRRQPAAFGQAMFWPQDTQPAVLAKGILAAVENLQNLDDVRGPAARVVHKHCALGILPEHYKYVHDSFLATTAEVLGAAVTEEVADAWSGVLLHISDFLINQEAALYDETTSAEDGWNTREPADFVVKKVERAARSMTSLYLERADGSPPPTYQPGQYATLCANPTNEKYFAPRHYTIAAPAPIGNAIRICVRHLKGGPDVPAGAMSTFVNTSVDVGDTLQFRYPFGVFTADLAQPFENVAWVTAGAGITTALAMAGPMADAGKNVVHWHADKDEESVAHAVELQELPLHASLRYFGGAKAFTLGDLVGHLADSGVDVMDPRTAVFLCCPPEMILMIRNGLLEKGVPMERILYETYGPLAN